MRKSSFCTYHSARRAGSGDAMAVCSSPRNIKEDCSIQAAGGRRQKAESRRQKAEGRKQKAESRRQKAGGNIGYAREVDACDCRDNGARARARPKRGVHRTRVV